MRGRGNGCGPLTRPAADLSPRGEVKRFGLYISPEPNDRLSPSPQRGEGWAEGGEGPRPPHPACGRPLPKGRGKETWPVRIACARRAPTTRCVFSPVLCPPYAPRQPRIRHARPIGETPRVFHAFPDHQRGEPVLDVATVPRPGPAAQFFRERGRTRPGRLGTGRAPLLPERRSRRGMPRVVRPAR